MKRLLASLLLLAAGAPAWAQYVGDYAPGTTVCRMFTTYQPSTGAAFALASGAVDIYFDGSDTQDTDDSGATLTASVDSVAGQNRICVDTSSDGTFYAAGRLFHVVLTAGTVDSVSVAGSTILEFSLNKEAALKPTVAGRALDVSAGGEAGVDWANVGSPTTTVNLSGTTISTSQAVASVSGAVGSVTGNVGGTVNGLTTTAQGNVRTAVGLASANLDTQLTTIDDFLDTEVAAIKTKTDFLPSATAGASGGLFIAGSNAATTVSITGNLTGNVTGSVGSVTGDIGGIAPNGLTLDAFNIDTNPLFGITRRGTAQSATSTSLVIDSAATFGDDTMNGMTFMACGSTQGYCQSRSATDYVGSTDTATVDTWSVTPSGTITYFAYGTAPTSGGSGGSLTAADVWGYGGGRTITGGTVTTNSDKTGYSLSGTQTFNNTGTWTGNVSGSIGSLGSTAQTNVQTAAAAALTAYDPPTNTEMEARTLVAANYATAAALATADGVADAIKLTTDKIDTALELDGSVYRFTTNALENAPTGSGGGASDWSTGEKEQIRHRLGIDGTATAPSATPSLATFAQGSSIETDTQDIQSRLPAALVSGRIDASVGAMASNVITAAALADDFVEEVWSYIVDPASNTEARCAVAVMMSIIGGDVTTSGGNSTYEDPSGTSTRATTVIVSAGNRSTTITCPSY
jgi:hypothetical protein